MIPVAGESVQVFEYPMQRLHRPTAAGVSPDGGSVGTTLSAWVGPPHFFVRGRVMALYVGTSTPVLTGLSGAMGAQIAGR